jgi:hypothetical protein
VLAEEFDDMNNPFGDIEVIGKIPLDEAALSLDALGDVDGAEVVRKAIDEQNSQRRLQGGVQPYSLATILGRRAKWAHTAHTLGFIPPNQDGVHACPIANAGSIPADRALAGQPLRISLNALRIASYPGFGMHSVLFDFYVQSKTTDGKHEDLHFNAVYRGQEGEHAGIVGQPIFHGVVPSEGGLGLRCLTVNIKNEADEKLIAFLERDVFKSGLRLLKTAQPAVGPLSEMAYGLITGLAKRARNVPVQDVYLGLDFGSTAGGARLAKGTYVAVQIPERLGFNWKWDEWVFDHSAGRIVLKSDGVTLVPYNYIALGIDSCTADA